MRRFVCIATVTAVILLSGAPAMAALTAYATWNAGPSTDPDWEPVDPLEPAAYPASAPEVGFDFVLSVEGPANAVSGWPFVTPRRYPNSDGVGKWGGALKDDPEDGSFYVTMHGGQLPGDPLEVLTAELGTVEFWFKPMWDPDPNAAEPDVGQHSLIMINRSSANKDGLFIHREADGSMRTTFKTQSLNQGGPDIEIGHDWNAILINDWNHVAFVWDASGNRTYANGSKVGETVYGPGDPTVEWSDHIYAEFGQEGQSTIEYQTNGEWDSLGIWSHVVYSGDTYDVPTEEIGPVAGCPGDLDGDDVVGQSDLDLVLGNWGQSVPPADERADPDGSGFVGQSDLDTVLGDWGCGFEAPVPEPATLSVLGLGGLALMRRRRN